MAIKTDQTNSNVPIFKKYNLQSEKISPLFNAQFTNREIDILSCILHGKSSKIIGVYLSISQRTVEVHMNNIMKKLGLHSKQHVLQHIEKKNCLHLFQEHYIALIEQHYFKLKLKDLKTELQKTSFIIKLYVGYADNLSRAIEEDLNLIDFQVQTIFEKNRTMPVLIFESIDKKHPIEINIEKFTNQYQLSFLKLFEFFIPKEKIDQIYKKYTLEYENNHIQIPLKLNYLKKINKLYFLIFPIILIVSLLLWNYVCDKKYTYYSNVHYLVHPANESIERKPLIQKISSIIKKGKFVILTGLGGAGKTTLAKMYTLSVKNKFSYLISCESKNTIQKSFREIGFILSKTKEEVSEFSQILNIIQTHERETKILEYVQKKLHQIDRWVLIFDNVNNFNDFNHYFPLNSKYWGNGHVIFTTRNANINCNFITNHIEILDIPTLTPEECSTLFLKIISSHIKDYKISTERLTEILNKVAPFPLDISLVAYYIKNSYYKVIDENIMNEITEYVQSEKFEMPHALSKTRHSIMKHGLEKIIESNSNYKTILYICSLLNSTQIPYDFLCLIHNKFELNEFIRKMHEYSFVEYEKINSSNTHQSIYFHNVVKKYIQEYMEKKLDQTEKKRIVSDFIPAFFHHMITKINEKDREVIVNVIPNLENFIINKNLSVSHTQKIRFLLALSYKLNYSYENSKKLFIENIRSLDSTKIKDMSFYAQNVAYLGIVYRNLGDFDSAGKYFDQCINIQQEEKIHDYFTFKIELEKAKLYRNKGLYQQAIDSNNKSLKGFKEYFPADYINIISILTSSGAVYRIMGEYKKAFDYLNEALDLSKTKFNHTKSIYPAILIQLGNLNRILGNYKMAQDINQKCVQTIKEYFSACQRDLAYSLTSLGISYKKRGKYKLAEKCFLESHQIFEKSFSKDYRENIWNLAYLGILNIKKDKLDEAKKLLLKADFILEKGFPKDYIDRAWLITHLAFIESCNNNYQRALLYLQHAEQIYNNQVFPKKHFFYAWFLMKKAEIYIKINKSEDAISCATESFELCKLIFGEKSIKANEYFNKYQKICLNTSK